MTSARYILLVVLFCSSCSNSVDTSDSNNEYGDMFSALLQESVDHSMGSVPGVSMSIISPHIDAPWTGAAGYADKELNVELGANQPYRIASVTKTDVAAAILRLHEMDSLSIEDPIADHLSESTLSMLASGGYEADKILIKHCLNHTSGLFDYIFGTELFANEITKNPKRRWSREDQLHIAMTTGEKYGEPGEQTVYSDTGYILLGEIIERYHQRDFAKGLRTLLKFDELGLASTWLETLEDHKLDNQPVVHRYFRGQDATEWDASIDLYGGGGLMATTADLAHFMHALFNNEVFDHPKTLDLMLSIPDYVADDEANDQKRISYYNYGLWTIKVYGVDAHLHNGYWGATMLYIPEYETSISINATRGKADRLMKKVIAVVKNLKDK